MCSLAHWAELAWAGLSRLPLVNISISIQVLVLVIMDSVYTLTGFFMSHDYRESNLIRYGSTDINSMFTKL